MYIIVYAIFLYYNILYYNQRGRHGLLPGDAQRLRRDDAADQPDPLRQLLRGGDGRDGDRLHHRDEAGGPMCYYIIDIMNANMN